MEVGKVLVPILRRESDDGLLKALMKKPIMPMSQCTIRSGDIVLSEWLLQSIGLQWKLPIDLCSAAFYKFVKMLYRKHLVIRTNSS